MQRIYSHAYLYSCLGYVSILSHLPIICIHTFTDIAGVFFAKMLRHWPLF